MGPFSGVLAAVRYPKPMRPRLTLLSRKHVFRTECERVPGLIIENYRPRAHAGSDEKDLGRSRLAPLDAALNQKTVSATARSVHARLAEQSGLSA